MKAEYLTFRTFFPYHVLVLTTARLNTSQSKSRKPGSWELGAGAQTWEWDQRFQICSSQSHVWSQLPAPSSQIHRSDWSSAGSWELGGPYRMSLRPRTSFLRSSRSRFGFSRSRSGCPPISIWDSRSRSHTPSYYNPMLIPRANTQNKGWWASTGLGKTPRSRYRGGFAPPNPRPRISYSI